MATNKRMFSNDIVASDFFLDMPLSTQALYFHLGMQADDRGFVQPKKVMRMLGSADNEIQLLISKKFLIPFEDGIVLVKHWRINNNKIDNDRFKETNYTEHLNKVFIKSNKAYTLDKTKGFRICAQNVHELGTQNRVEENRIEKNNTTGESKKFIIPKVEEIEQYCKERKNKVDPQHFFDHYQARGWIPKGYTRQMKDWKAAVRTWEKSNVGKMEEIKKLQFKIKNKETGVIGNKTYSSREEAKEYMRLNRTEWESFIHNLEIIEI